jgi:chromosome segregation ATPase
MEQTSDARPHSPENRTPAGASALEPEKEALRIQAAAVAAQQAALLQEEICLRHRRVALEQQEQQLATHLEEKRRRLLDLRDEARQAHAALQQTRAAYEKRVAQIMQDLTRSRQELADGQRLIQAERQRVLDLRQRLKRRFHRHWSSERMTMRLREAALAKQGRALENERERLKQEKTGLMQARMHFNGEMELGRRRLQADWEHVRKDQAGLHERASALDLRERALEAEHRQRAEEKHHWEETRFRLQQEVEGLESRVANFRRRLLDEQQKLDRLQNAAKPLPPSKGSQAPSFAESEQTRTDLPPAVLVSVEAQDQQHGPLHPTEAEWRNRVATLERIAGDLADQRLYLAEQYERLARAQQQWEQEHSSVATELEALAQRLHQREEAIQVGEEGVTVAEDRLDQRSAEMARQQGDLEGRSAQLAARAAVWDGEKDLLLASLRVREDLVAQQLAALSNLRQCWAKRRLRQVCRLRAQCAACEELRREGEALRLECSRRGTLLGKEQRALLERALALEQYRQRWIARAANPKAAEKRLERLRRRWAALAASAERTLAQERKALETQAARLEERARQLQQDADELNAREAELTTREAAWEQQQLQDQAEHEKIRQELDSLRRQRQSHEQQIATLREEVERLARLLLDDDSKPSPAMRAA